MPVRGRPRSQGLTLAEVVTDAVLDAAYAWLCQQRWDWPAEADVWRFRQHWPEEKAQLRADLLAGTYEVGLLSQVTLQNGEEVVDPATGRSWRVSRLRVTGRHRGKHALKFLSTSTVRALGPQPGLSLCYPPVCGVL